jgi:hypothetical protein
MIVFMRPEAASTVQLPHPAALFSVLKTSCEKHKCKADSIAWKNNENTKHPLRLVLCLKTPYQLRRIDSIERNWAIRRSMILEKMENMLHVKPPPGRTDRTDDNLQQAKNRTEFFRT